jgi:hypothetical protein
LETLLVIVMTWIGGWCGLVLCQAFVSEYVATYYTEAKYWKVGPMQILCTPLLQDFHLLAWLQLPVVDLTCSLGIEEPGFLKRIEREWETSSIPNLFSQK